MDLIIKKEKYKIKKRIIDIGTGSGCIAISLKNNLKSEVIGIDISKGAIELAQKNNIKNDINFLCSSIEDYRLNFLFDIIVSNPPYIPYKDINLVEGNVKKYEPHIALFVKRDPLYFYKKILIFSKKYLSPQGKIYLEINDLYHKELKNVFSEFDCHFINDINSKKRFLIINF